VIAHCCSSLPAPSEQHVEPQVEHAAKVHIESRTALVGWFALITCLLVGCRDPAVARKWLADWETARACMLSSPEYGPDSETAFAVSTLLKDTHCFDERLQLMLIADEDRQSVPGWTELREELDPVVRGYSAGGSAIDRIDARVVRLRDQAGLPAKPRTRSRTLAALTAGRHIAFAGTQRPAKMTIGVEDGKIVALARDGDNTLHVEIESPDDVHTWTVVPRGHALAYPSRTWAAGVRNGVLSVVELTNTKQTTEIELPGAIWASAAMDAGSTRAVFVQLRSEAGGFAVAVSTDSGRKWRIERSADDLPLSRSSQDPVTGAVDIVVYGSEYAFLHRFDRIEPWQFAERVEIPKFEHHFVCRDSSVLWAMDPRNARSLLRVTPPTSRVFELAEVYPSGVEDCRDTSALVLRKEAFRQYLDLCRGDGCTTVHKAQHNLDSAAALLDDGSWMYAAANGTVVGVWREGAPEPAFYRLQKAGNLVKLVVLKGKPYLVLVIDGGYQFVALPPS